MSIDPELQKKVQALEAPFDPADLSWKPQSTNKEKNRALVAVYADPRVYSDRLNEVFGHDGWSEHYTTETVPYTKVKKGWNGAADTITSGHKLIVTCTVQINDLGQHSSMGESPTDDENVATSAEAQAFKRACMKFGLGRYLYNFPKDQWCPYDDKTKKVTQPPELPDWAIPKTPCEDCSGEIKPFAHKDTIFTVGAIIDNGRQKYQKTLCADCQRKRAEQAKEASGTRLK